MNLLPDNDTPDTPKSPIDVVVDQLGQRVVPVKDRERLGKALDRANAAPTGRAGSDEGLGRAIGR